MEIAVSVGTSLADRATTAVVDGTLQQFRYVLDYRDNMTNLKGNLRDLQNSKDRVTHLVDEAKRRLEQIEGDVLTWISRVDEAILRVDSILTDDGLANKTCCAGRLPNFKNRYKLSKRAKLEAPSLPELTEKGNKFDRVGYRVPLHSRVLSSKDYEAFGSRESTLNSIMQTLRDNDADLIGVWGLGGVGKTTFSKEVGQRMKQEGVFKLVITAEVHPEADIKTIQARIAEWVDIKKEVESLDSIELRATLLHKRLLQEESVLVILDDVWAVIDLKKVGIPIDGDTNRCTVLVTTRDEAVVSQMVVQKQKKFLINVLRDDEAWELFQKTTSLIHQDDLVHHNVAVQIVKMCGGLPILLLPVATALKGKGLLVWEDALWRLESGLHNNRHGTQAQAYSALELSCSHLNAEQMSVFLFCGLLKRHSIQLDDMVKYMSGLRLFKDCLSIKATRSRLLNLLGDLMSSCLLMKGGSHSIFTMHDVVHSFSRGYLDHVFSPLDFSKVEEWPDMHVLRQLTQISLRYCKLPDLPTRLECPKLEVLLLFMPPGALPDRFFDAVEELRVLDLTRVRLSPFPSSLQHLQNLQTLCLDYCTIEDATVIGNLTRLKILSLFGSDLTHLPKEIGKLTCLQLLDLTRCMELKKISPGVLSSLIHLEELYMTDSFTQWGLRDETDGQQINADLAELKKLKKLTTLEIGVIDVKSLPDDLFSDKLERFFIVIGDCWDCSRNDDVSGTLKVKLDASIRVLKNLDVLLKKAEDLHLDNSVGVKDVDLPELNMEGFGNRLRNLQLQNFHEVRYLVDSVQRGPSIAFPKLEALAIDNAQHLEKICNGPLKEGSLGNLKQIKISSCDALSNVFPLSLARCLSKLEDIEVTYCEKMEGIFVVEDEAAADKDEKICLSRLRKLTLEHLPRLDNILTSTAIQEIREDVVASDSLDNGSTLPLTFFTGKVSFPNIEDLKVSSIRICKMWEDEFSNSYAWVRNLVTLTIDGCKFVKDVFTVSMVSSLAELKRLNIQNCGLLEEIIFSEKHGEANRICLPKLEFLYFKQLLSLRTVCTGGLIECPNLKILWIDDCPELKTFITSSQKPCESLFDNKVLFPSLEEMRISNMDSLIMLWDEELHEDSFTKLKCLMVEKAKRLSKLFSSTMLRKFHTLEKLKLEKCDLLEEVFHLHDLISERGKHPETICMLTEMIVYHLPNLKHVWHGDPHGILSFQNLSKLDFWDCSSMEDLIPTSVSQQLPRLEELELNDCSILEQIISGEERYKQGVQATFVYPSLKQICLWNCPSLSSFYPGQYIINWPALQHVSIITCPGLDVFKSELVPKEAQLGHQSSLSQPLFLFEQVIVKLVSVSLSNKELHMIQRLELPDILSSMIKDITFHGFDVESGNLPINLLKRFPNLEKVEVRLGAFVELFTNKILDEEKETMALSRIQHLDLRSLYRLEHIWNPQSKLDHVLNNLRSLLVCACDCMIHLAPPSASFCNLTTLDVANCNSLVSLFTFATMTSLVQLREMKIYNCAKLTEIVSVSGEKLEGEAQICLYKLEILKLSELGSITSFCSYNNSTLKFPLLVDLVVENCPQMELFSNGYLRAPRLKSVWNKDNNRWKGDLNTTVRQLYTERVVTKLSLSKQEFQMMQKLEHDGYSSMLKVVKVYDFDGESPDVLINFLKRFPNLEKLEVDISDFVELFTYKILDEEKETIPLPQIQYLDLQHLAKLEHIWNPQAKLDRILTNLKSLLLCWCDSMIHLALPSASFCNLMTLCVGRCKSLVSLFTFSTMTSLVQLREMLVYNCDKLIEIVAVSDEKIEEEAQICLYKLEVLKLSELGSITSFCSQNNATLKFPVLVNLIVEDCPQMEFFSNGYLSAPKLKTMWQTWNKGNSRWKDDLNTTVCQLYTERVTKLERESMSLSKHGFQMMQKLEHGVSSSTLKAIKVYDFNGESPNLLINFLERYPNLEKLEVELSDFVELFTYEILDDENETVPVPQIQHLELRHLDKLEHIWNPQAKLDRILNSLTFLLVCWCDSMIHLAPPSASLCNLTTLNVGRCEKLVSLFTLSTMRSLVQLREMIVYNCGKLTEIVAVSDEKIEGEAQICLDKLQILKLSELGSITSFCSQNNSTLKFPSLVKLVVEECPQMEFFSLGYLSAPKLETVWLTWNEDDSRWKGDLNTTVRQLYTEKVVTKLDLNKSEFRKMQNQELSDVFSSSIKAVKFHDFNGESPNLLINFLERYPNLEKLEVELGDFVELFTYEILDDENETVPVPQIQHLDLRNLDKLEHIWNPQAKLDRILKNLKSLLVLRCDRMIHLAPPSASFCNLTTLHVGRSESLVNLFTFSTMASLVQLRELLMSVKNTHYLCTF